MKNKTIAVIGATGSQGSGVVEALVKEGSFNVRAITRDPAKYSGKADEVIKADLSDFNSLRSAFEGAHGVFVVTNFMEGADEFEQGQRAVQAAKEAGINHFIWSTLPNIDAISGGEFQAPNFSKKAKVDVLVKTEGFENYTFVQAPFYFQNFTGMLSPQPLEDGSVGWALPIDPAKEVVHMADIRDLGKVVAGAFLNPELVGNGSYLSVAVGRFSFNQVLAEFKANGKDYSFVEVPKDVFSTLFEGADVITQSFAYFEAYTYMGPNSDSQIQLASEIATENLTSLADWVSSVA